MYRKRFTGMNCTIARALDEVGEWWSLLIVRECTQGTTRFDEFQRELGIARNVLAARLERLIESGIIERFPLADRANTDGYRLTPKGEALYPVLVALKQWGDDWLAPDGKPPLEMLDKETGEPIERIAVQARNGTPLSFRDIRFAAGPGATSTTARAIANRNRRILGQPADDTA
ncbi:winged helix-turn-helix transcriptional regulator [Bordetella bronchialis]|uniref:HxlR family transcriptional regulator n=1 Tax=Bordetella bronchialis TaxID=463025 RepID=A0A193FLJ9_9BORD|nr:helix-turn-helix domain-containing protein [Bordetella bronchialis]ANN68637.1 HxlR family transcriptional regulator [Bordetella bronchialis]ANN73777.1 HxlR family transcriptional regulator [Bordetella bronchialis]